RPIATSPRSPHAARVSKAWRRTHAPPTIAWRNIFRTSASSAVRRSKINMPPSAVDLFDLSGRVAVVTGASSGIGRAIALAFAQAGAAVVLVARRASMLDAVRDEIGNAGGRAASLPCDLADRASLKECAARAGESFGAPDILVSAAGTNRRKSIVDVTEDDWDATLRLNLDAPFLLAQCLAPAMIGR